jgi:hypothetical protein
VTLTEGLTVGDLAIKLDVKSKDMIKKLMERGVFAASANEVWRTFPKAEAPEPGSGERRSNYTQVADRWQWNPNGIPSFSPGLRRRSFP